MAVEYDPRKSASNYRKHKVRFSDAVGCFSDPLAITVEDPDAEGEIRFISVALDSLGRVLVVVHTPRGKNARIISARKASPGETKDYYAR